MAGPEKVLDKTGSAMISSPCKAGDGLSSPCIFAVRVIGGKSCSSGAALFLRPAPGTSQPKIAGLSRPSRGAHPRRAWPCGELDKPENCQVCPVLSPVARQTGWSIRPHGSSLHQSPRCCHAAHINNRITSSTQQNLCLFCCVQSRNVKNRNICAPALNPCGSPSALAAPPPWQPLRPGSCVASSPGLSSLATK